MSDDFEAAGSTVNSNLWPLASSTHVETGQTWFGAGNRYLRLTGGSTKALSANWGSQLNGHTSTFAFDYYEPSTSTNSLTLGYSAGNSDINTAEAFARIALSYGSVSRSSATGVVLTATGTTVYPRDRRLTFSLALNHTAASQSFNGGVLAARTMDVWYYNWSTGQKIYVMTLSVTNSPRTPLRVGFRTFSVETGVQAYFDNVKLLDDLEVVTADFAPTNAPVPPSIPPQPFVHPSALNTQEELDRIKYRVNYEPASAARLGWNQMTNSSLAWLNYQHVPYSNVVVKASGTTPSETQYRRDAHAAYAAALQWVITGNTQYRDKALTILNDWSATFVTMSPDAGTSTAQIQLEAAWVAPIWIAAADIIRYYNEGAAGWSSNDIARFDGMLNYLYSESAQAATRDNNWGASAALTMIATGVYQDNRARYDAGVQTWRSRMIGINALVDSYNDDSIYEVCRDVTHPQYTLQVWMQAAEIARQQGTDLYGMTIEETGPPQLARNVEYFAELFMGLRPTPCDATFNATYSYPGKQSQSGAYDIAHNHYINRQGSTNMPVYSDMVVNHWRPGGFDDHFVGWSTLTHGDLSAGIPVVGALVLTNTSMGTGRGALADGGTINLRDYTNAVWSIAAQITGTVSWVEFQTNGVAFSLADSNTSFATASLPPPGNYFVQALPWKAMPSGTIAGDPFVRFVRVIDLPASWNLDDIGLPVMSAWASEAGAVFTLAAAGSGISGGADQFGFVSAEITGDLQITAQITNTVPVTAGTLAGIMVRDGTTPGARNVFFSFAPLAASQLALSCRAIDQGATSNVTSAALAGTPWLRLVRFGNVFTAYYSSEGKSWTAIGSVTVPMNAHVEAGLVAASGLTDTVARTDFRNVLIEPLNASYTEWQDWMFVRRGVTDPTVTGSGSDPDNDSRSNEAEFRLGSDPLNCDSVPAVNKVDVADGMVRFDFTERKNAAELGRVFQYSTNMVDWASITPSSIAVVEDFGSVVVREVVFPVTGTSGFYRCAY